MTKTIVTMSLAVAYKSAVEYLSGVAEDMEDVHKCAVLTLASWFLKSIRVPSSLVGVAITHEVLSTKLETARSILSAIRGYLDGVDIEQSDTCDGFPDAIDSVLNDIKEMTR